MESGPQSPPRPGARRPARSRERPDAAAAFEIAARFLATRPRSGWELQQRLRRAGAEDHVIAETTDRLRALGYLDDDAFARWWTEQRDRHAPRGQRMLEAELRQHGVQGEALERFREGNTRHERPPTDDMLPRTEAERARKAVDRHLRGRPMPDDPKAIARLGAFLMRRGFDAATVRGALRERANLPLEEIDE
ncbi:MAG: regulatory protein RecX [Candidatus Limnocylindria bacterium]